MAFSVPELHVSFALPPTPVHGTAVDAVRESIVESMTDPRVAIALSNSPSIVGWRYGFRGVEIDLDNSWVVSVLADGDGFEITSRLRTHNGSKVGVELPNSMLLHFDGYDILWEPHIQLTKRAGSVAIRMLAKSYMVLFYVSALPILQFSVLRLREGGFMLFWEEID